MPASIGNAAGNISSSISRQLPPPRPDEGAAAQGPECHPKPTAATNQYIVAYGSLMQQASKEQTVPRTEENTPIRIYGFTRHWNTKGESIGYSTTFLGARVATRKDYFNGGYFKIPSVAVLNQFDTRESFYCREEVVASKIQVLQRTSPTSQTYKALPAGQYWIYVTKPQYDEPPSRQYPMVQSYVDTFLSGCMELEEKHNLPGFSDECIETTTDWVNPWVNDRLLPRRPHVYQPKARAIDRLINRKIPQAFRNIIIE